LYYSSAAKKAPIPTSRLVREREHFSRNVMVSVAVSKYVGKTNNLHCKQSACIRHV